MKRKLYYKKGNTEDCIISNFNFGRNWKLFSERVLNESRVDAAVLSLEKLFGKTQLANKSFLDIGCGSGVFSIAADRLGAQPVLGIDVNPLCVDVALDNKDRFAPGTTAVEFVVGSVLDPEWMATLGIFDIVYSWGVLHHTGNMWAAIANAANRVTSKGLLVIAIYNKHRSSILWRWIKWAYNKLPAFFRWGVIQLFVPVIYLAKYVVTGKNPLSKARGMDFYVDVVDWVGGFPYEYASIDTVIRYVETLGYKKLKVIPAEVPTGCNEFVFERVV